jgi:hypothetical protein
MELETLILTHNAGFFSCYTVRLHKILEYFNKNKKTPTKVDSSKQFLEYKENPLIDYTNEYISTNDSFEIIYSNEIKITYENSEDQFSNYKNLNFKEIKPFIDKYFLPSNTILEIMHNLEIKYNLEFDNIVACYYRGTDKIVETNRCEYNEFIKKVKELNEENKKFKFLILSDEISLINLFKTHFQNTIVFDELIQNMTRSFKHSQIMLACVLIMSRCKHIVCTSGNVSMWGVLFRGNNKNIHQYLSHKEYIYGIKNNYFNPNKQNFWI